MQNLKSKFKIKINSKTLYFLLVLLSFEFLFLNLDKARASALSLGIDPPIIIINAIPPTNVTNSISIQNKSDTQITLQIQIKSFKAKGENGELEYSREALEILKNIQVLDAGIPVETITLGPKQQKNLNLNIDMPQDTIISDYYFSIIFTSVNLFPAKSNSSLNQVGIATNVLLSIGPLETPKASVEEFSSKLFFEKGPVPFVVRIKNEGIRLIKPKGEIIVKNMFGQNIGKLDLTSVNILSDSIRAIPNDIYTQESRLKDNSSTKTETPLDFRHPIALWKEGFLLGFYTATLNISMSNEGPSITRTIHFFAFPFRVLIFVVAAVITIIIVNKKIKARIHKNP